MKQFVQVGETFGDTVTLSTQDIASFATALHDSNPLHHDPAFAKTTRFGQIIASGPHTAGIFMGLTASHLSKIGAVLGIGFDLKFAGPAFANRPIAMRWRVTRTEWKEKLNGELVFVEGTANHSDAEPVLAGTGTLLICETL